MAAALIRIDQATHPTQVIGTPGTSRDDIVLATQVQLSNADDTGVRSSRWELLAKPAGSVAVVSSPIGAAITFTPDLVGTYRIRLKVNEGRKGEVSTLLVAVRDGLGFRIPAASEEAEANWDGNTAGWEPDVSLLLRSIANANVLFTMKNSARLATDAALPAHAFDSGAGTLTASGNGALLVDTVAVAINDRIVVKGEGGGTSAENGLFRVVQTGDAGNPWILVRTEDADTDDKVKAGMFVVVTEGANEDRAWFITTNDPIAVNTTPITWEEFPLTVVIPSLAQVLGVGGNLTGANDIVANSGQALRGIDAADATVTGLITRGGDYSGSGTDNAGPYASRGGNTTSANSNSAAGPWDGLAGNANGGVGGFWTGGGGNSTLNQAGPFLLGGSTGVTAALSQVLGSETTANNPAGALLTAGGDASGGGIPAVLTNRGGEPKTVDTNNRAAAGIISRGGDGGGQGLTGSHDGGPADHRGGDGVGSGGGGVSTLRGGNSGSGTNAQGAPQNILGGSSTGNRDGGFINNTGGAAADSGDGGSWTWVPGASGSGIVGTMVVGSAAVDFTGNALNVTGANGRALFYDNASNTTDKAANIGLAHFTNAEEPFFVLLPRVTTSANVLNVGGGDSIGNAATLIDFFTAANNTTPTGTSRMTINSAGLVTVTGNFTMSGTSPIFAMGDGVTAGSPTFNLLKGPTGSTILNFFDTDVSASNGDYRIRHSSAEQLLVEEHDGTTFRVSLQFISPASVLVMSGAQSSALLTIGNPSFATGDEARILLQSGATGVPAIQFDSSANEFNFSVSSTSYAWTMSGVQQMSLSSTVLTLATNNLVLTAGNLTIGGTLGVTGNATFNGATTSFLGTNALVFHGDGTDAPAYIMRKGEADTTQFVFRKTTSQLEDDKRMTHNSAEEWTIEHRGSAAWFEAITVDGTSTAASIAVLGAAPALRQTISGARDNPEAALADLLTAVALFGWITDSTTAS